MPVGLILGFASPLGISHGEILALNRTSSVLPGIKGETWTEIIQLGLDVRLIMEENMIKVVIHTSLDSEMKDSLNLE